MMPSVVDTCLARTSTRWRVLARCHRATKISWLLVSGLWNDLRIRAALMDIWVEPAVSAPQVFLGFGFHNLMMISSTRFLAFLFILISLAYGIFRPPFEGCSACILGISKCFPGRTVRGSDSNRTRGCLVHLAERREGCSCCSLVCGTELRIACGTFHKSTILL